MTRPLRPDTTFVLWIDAFMHRVEGGYECSVFNGAVRKLGVTMTPAVALAHLAAHPSAVVQVLHV